MGDLRAAVWAEATKVPIINLATKIIGSQVQMSPSPQGVPNPFSLSDTDNLKILWLEQDLKTFILTE
jgi:hypothetical protein